MLCPQSDNSNGGRSHRSEFRFQTETYLQDPPYFAKDAKLGWGTSPNSRRTEASRAAWTGGLSAHCCENQLLIFQDFVEGDLVLFDNALIGKDRFLVFHDGRLVGED